MSKVKKEFGSALSVEYPQREYPQDLIDSQIMPALRRSYDRARRENWRMAKETTSSFELMTGPVFTLWKHVNDEPCASLFDEKAPCEWCSKDVPQVTYGYMHHFGWYVAVEIEEDDNAVSQ